ncbi:MAG: hypothetical protein [Caudoviricetes sp.]|nr:MAG: hypothetical protein [Caudoviricetes sp.]
MPLYEYKCPENHVFEKIKKFSESLTEKCPVCKLEAQKQITAPKGINGGFYDTKMRVQ